MTNRRLPLLLLLPLVLEVCPGASVASGQEADPRGADSPVLADPPVLADLPVLKGEIDVVGITPLQGTALDPDRVPFTIERLDEEALERAGALGLATALGAEVAGAHSAAVQNNPLQNDVFVRGFSSSPLLGSSQGLSLWVDGVRVNEVFGDVVLWDLQPRAAVRTVQVSKGAWTVFGANSLGGALSLETRSGFDHDRTRIEAGLGSWDRRELSLRHGHAGERLAYFLSGEIFDEDGWRDASPSESRLGHLEVGGRSDVGAWSVALDWGDNLLVGNGAAPIELLERNRAAVFTFPDETDDEVLFPRFNFSRVLSPRVHLESVLSYRSSDIDTFNADDFDADEDPDSGEEYVDEDSDDESGPDAADNRSTTGQESFALATEISFDHGGGGADAAGGTLIAGVSLDEGRAEFDASTELAFLTQDRTTIGTGIFVPDAFVGVDAETSRRAVFATESLRLAAGTTLLAQLRWQDDRVVLVDRIGEELNGNHRYDRANAGVGLSHALRSAHDDSLVLFGGVSQASRTPTPVELTCADPEDPCRLPNAFVADPPLDDPVVTSFELGLRGRSSALSWDVAAFHSEARDDLVFISSGRLTNAGHFTNVEATRRRGIEASLRGRHRELAWFVSATGQEATFEDRFSVQSVSHPAAIDGEIEVEPGDRLPGVPDFLWKAGVDYRRNRSALWARARGGSQHPYRGDEANLLEGVPGFESFDLGASFQVLAKLSLAIEVANLFDDDAETFGVLGDPSEVLGDEFRNPRFLGPAPPRFVALRAIVDL